MARPLTSLTGSVDCTWCLLKTVSQPVSWCNKHPHLKRLVTSTDAPPNPGRGCPASVLSGPHAKWRSADAGKMGLNPL